MPEWTQYVLWVASAVVAVILAYGLWARWKLWKKGAAGSTGASFWLHLKMLLVVSVFQRKVLRRWFAGFMHLVMYTGFIALLIGTGIVALNMDILAHFDIDILRQNLYLLFEAFLDFMGLAFLLGLGMAFFRRLVQKPKYLREEGADLYLPGILLLLVLQGFVLEGVRLAVLQPQWQEWSFVGYFLSLLFRAAGINGSMLVPGTLTPIPAFAQAYGVFWWFHAGTTFLFVATIPWTKASHFAFSPLNTYFERALPYGRLEKPFDVDDLMKPDAPQPALGTSTTKTLPWFNRVQLDACTICGRCTSVCPAWVTGKPLDPMHVILDLREAMARETKGVALGETLPDFVGYEELWACTTCMACMQECPVSIRHVPFIVDLRRNLTMELGRIPETTQAMLRNIETNYNPWGVGWDQRARWAEGLGVKTMAEASAAGEAVDVLYWVGCAASFDDRNRKVAQSFARLLQKAGVRFAILGPEEKCTGDPARRVGNEYLAQTMAKANVETLNRYAVKKIVTACPHCFNAIKHEYPDFGGKYEVVHHSVFLDELLKAGKLTPTTEVRELLTYHDSCYLGRYNKVYKEPRDVLSRIPGMRTVEMEQCRDKGLCCGAGGARMWMEETGEKVNHRRLAQIEKTGADAVASACPYCLIMLDDAAKTKDREDIKRYDVAELVERSLQSEFRIPEK